MALQYTLQDKMALQYTLQDEMALQDTLQDEIALQYNNLSTLSFIMHIFQCKFVCLIYRNISYL